MEVSDCVMGVKRPPEISSKLDFAAGRDLNAKQVEGKASLHEGHGFSRAVNRPSNDGFSR